MIKDILENGINSLPMVISISVKILGWEFLQATAVFLLIYK